MSSHHIVREKQEPALYIHRLGDFSEEYLGQLLEWSPTLLVQASEYEKVISLGLKVDVVFNPGINDSTQESTKVVNTMHDDISGVLNYLVTEKYPAVNIIDQNSDLKVLDYYFNLINIVVFTPDSKSYPVKSGFSVWKPQHTVFSIPLTAYFETSNLLQNEQGEFVVVKDGFIDFTFSTSYLFITEKL